METKPVVVPLKATRQIKAMDTGIWQRALDGAEAKRESLAEWVGRAITELADAEEGKPSLMPRAAGNPRETPALPALPSRAPMIASAGDFGAMMAGAAAMAQAAGVAIPAGHAKAAFALMGKSIGQARGLKGRRGAPENLKIGKETRGKPDGNPAALPHEVKP